MFNLGNLLSSTIKVVALPLDAANAGLDLLAGGDGTKESRLMNATPLTLAEELRDRVVDSAKEVGK